MTNVLVSIAHIPARTSTITDSFPIVYLPQRILDFPEHSISYLPVSAGLGGHAVELLVEDLGEASVAGHGYLLDHGVYKVSLALYEHIMNNTNFPSRCPPFAFSRQPIVRQEVTLLSPQDAGHAVFREARRQLPRKRRIFPRLHHTEREMVANGEDSTLISLSRSRSPA